MQSPDAVLPVDDDACFACGSRNADGLALVFTRLADGTASAQVTLDAKYQGYRGIAHGGMVMLLLDEVMAHAGAAAGEKVVTAAVAVRFRAPVPLGVPLSLAGRVVSKRGSIVKVSGVISDAAGATLATAEGSFVSTGPLDPNRRGNSVTSEMV